MIVLCIAASIAVYVKGLLDTAPLKAGIQYILQSINTMSLIGLAFMLLIGGGLLGGVSYLVISFGMN